MEDDHIWIELRKTQKSMFKKKEMDSVENLIRNNQHETLIKNYKSCLINEKIHFDIGFIIHFLLDHKSSNNISPEFFKALYRYHNSNQLNFQEEVDISEEICSLPIEQDALKSNLQLDQKNAFIFVIIPTIFNFFISQNDCDNFLSIIQTHYLQSSYLSVILNSIFIIPAFLHFIQVVFLPILSPLISKRPLPFQIEVIGQKLINRWRKNAHLIPSLIKQILRISPNPESILWSSFFEHAFNDIKPYINIGDSQLSSENSHYPVNIIQFSFLQFYGFIESFQEPSIQLIASLYHFIHSHIHDLVEIILDPSIDSQAPIISQADIVASPTLSKLLVHSSLNAVYEETIKSSKPFAFPDKYEIKFIRKKIPDISAPLVDEEPKVYTPEIALTNLLQLSDPLPKNLFQFYQKYCEQNPKIVEEQKIARFLEKILVKLGNKETLSQRSICFSIIQPFLKNVQKLRELLYHVDESNNSILKIITKLSIFNHHLNLDSPGTNIFINFLSFILMKKKDLPEFSSISNLIKKGKEMPKLISKAISEDDNKDINPLLQRLIITRHLDFNDFLSLRPDLCTLDILCSNAFSSNPIRIIRDFVPYSHALYKVLSSLPSIPELSELMEKILAAFQLSSPYHKLQMISETFIELYRYLIKLLPYGSEFGPDDKNGALLSLLVYANPPHLVSNLIYVETYAPLKQEEAELETNWIHIIEVMLVPVFGCKYPSPLFDYIHCDVSIETDL